MKKYENETHFWTGGNNEGDFENWKWTSGEEICDPFVPTFKFRANCLAADVISFTFKGIALPCCEKLPFVCETHFKVCKSKRNTHNSHRFNCFQMSPFQQRLDRPRSQSLQLSVPPVKSAKNVPLARFALRPSLDQSKFPSVLPSGATTKRPTCATRPTTSTRVKKRASFSVGASTTSTRKETSFRSTRNWRTILSPL
ncbi:hypothetical protein L596_015353 [Steinernema carpocapsae]|uniref:C-type lectin domain-containing protein n=1 Tax=Steinernema carpocapsae TaxID=34508 RepID=A0A4U5NG09_STECR|nr:hypothetical protein L596_015353 [Steinernema carpocapsae]